MSQPLISIILAVYNGRADRLSQSIDSVLNQTYTNRELIIVNDASINDIENTIFAYSEEDKRIKYIKNEENLHVVKTRNKGILASSGELINFLDQDDFFHTEKLEKQVAFLEKNKDYGLCGSAVTIVDGVGKHTTTIKNRESDKDIRANILGSNQFTCGAVLFRRSVLNKVGLLNDKFRKADEYDLRLRIGKKSKMYNIPEFLFYYRDHDNNVTKSSLMEMKRKSLKLSIIYLRYYPNKVLSIIKQIVNIILPQKFTQKILCLIK